MPKRSSDKPRCTTKGNTTIVELGTFKVTINALHETGRAERFRLSWYINGRRFTRNSPSHKAAMTLAEAALNERAKGQEPATVTTSVGASSTHTWEVRSTPNSIPAASGASPAVRAADPQ